MNDQPYIGLRPFERDETELFFGREQHSDELIDRLGGTHFLAVVGTSGCGKSSLVKTGLIAGLEAGFLATASSSYWRIVEMRPSNHPFQALADKLLQELNAELSPHYTPETLQQRLRQGSLSLHELLAERPLANNAQLLIVCDQFEELFRYAEQGASVEAGNFVSLLLASSKPYPISKEKLSHSIFVVITMRSDFLGDCAQFAGLAEAINQGLYLTPRLNTEQLRAAIEEPALVSGGEIDPALIARLLEDAENNQDQLPLLQHVLMRLWDLAKDKTQPITLKDYENLRDKNNPKQDGTADVLGVALSIHADEAYLTLSKRHQKLAKLLFCQLTGQDMEKRDTRRPLKLGKLVEISKQEYSYADVVTVLDAFRQPGRGFLQPPMNETLIPETPENLEKIIDISHESLIRQWQRLQDWVQEEAKQAETYRHLVDEAQRRKQGDGFKLLMQSPELEAAVKWLDEFKPTVLWAERYVNKRSPYEALAEYGTPKTILSPIPQAASRLPEAEYELALINDYVKKSQTDKQEQLEQKDKEQKRKLRHAWIVSIGATLGLLIAVGLAFWAAKNEKLRIAELFQARLTHASLLAKGEDYAGAKKILAETYALDEVITPEKLHQRNLLASFSEMKGGEAEQVYEGAGYSLFTVGVSPDGKLLAAGGEHGTLAIFDVKTGKLLQRLEGHSKESYTAEGQLEDNSIYHIVFSPNGEELISSGDDKNIIVWKRDRNKQFSLKTSWLAADKVMAIAISPDGLTLASGGDDKEITLRDLATGKIKGTLKKQHSQRISENGLSFNATGDLIASGSYDNTAIIWEVATGKPRRILTGHTGNVHSVTFSPDSKTLLTGSGDKSLRLWSVDTDEPPVVLTGHTNRVFAAIFIGNGDYLLSGSHDLNIRIWDRRSGISLRLLQGHTAGVSSLATYAGQLFSANQDGTVRRWNLVLPYQQQLKLKDKVPKSLAISPTDKSIAVGFENGLLQYYSLPDLQLLWEKDKAHSGDIYHLTFNSTGNLLATAGFDDYLAKIWNVKQNDLSEIQIFNGHSSAVYSVAISPDSHTLATSSYDGTIGLFQLGTEIKQFIQAHTLCQSTGCTEAVSFSQDGTQLLSNGNADRTTKLWNIQTKPPSLIKEFPKSNDELLWSSLSHDNYMISMVGRGENTIVNIKNNLNTKLVGHEQTIYKSLFALDSATLATVSVDATVKLWNVSQGTELLSLRLPTHSFPPTPLWDFDFRCLKTCRLAVPLTEGKLLLYRFSYEDKPDFANDITEQKHTTLALWQDYLKLTATLLQQNALPRAQQAYREAEVVGKSLIKQFPDDVSVQQAKLVDSATQVVLHMYSGNTAEGTESMLQVLELSAKVLPNDPEKLNTFNNLLMIVNSYTQLLKEKDQSKQIIDIHQHLLALPLSNVNLLVSRADWAKKLGNQAAVDKDLQQALTLVGRQNADELNSVGYGLATLSNRYEEAYPLLKRAVTLKPDNANILDSIGWVLHKLGKNPDALDYLQAATCKKDQLTPETLKELDTHKSTVIKAMGLSKEPTLICQQVEVQKIIPDSQAEAVGLLAGDILLTYDGKAVINTSEFIKGREQERKDGVPKKLTVLRQGKTLSFDISYGKMGAELKDIDKKPSD
jgi:WD40 repeat protein/Tfp pilus assembly protein PilF